MTLEDYYNRLKLDDTAVVIRAGLRAVPKGRPRFAGNHAYTPAATREFEAQIKTLAKSIMGHRLPYSCPVSVTLTLVEVVPVSWPKLKKEMALAGMIVPSRGDLDNREKAVFDALNGVVFYDDVQICRKSSSKAFGAANLLIATVERSGLSETDIERWTKMKKV
jgi:Holliday junction resolvase RusA-like endonuclease